VGKFTKLNPRFICDNYPSEYSAAIRIYGGWRQAVVGNAIPYEKVIKKSPAQQGGSLDAEYVCGLTDKFLGSASDLYRYDFHKSNFT